MYKQFAERQLMMKLLGQEEEGDDMDTIDLNGMASFMLGRWLIAKDEKNRKIFKGSMTQH